MSTVKICHAKGPEGSGTNGNRGDSTGREVFETDWYAGGWQRLIRYEKDSDVAYNAAQAAIKIANDNLTGYSQADRNDLYKQLKANNWDVDSFIKAKVKTNADCSSFVYSCYCIYLPSLRKQIENYGNAYYCGNFEQGFKDNGFSVYTGKNYTQITDNLKTGDILLKSSHVVMVTDTGESQEEYQKKQQEMEEAAQKELLNNVNSIEKAIATTSIEIVSPEYKSSKYAGTYKINTANLFSEQLSDKTNQLSIPKGTICVCDGSYSKINKITLLLVKYLINNKLYYTYCPYSYLTKVN